jgi:putative DNA primase/helicase
MRAVIDGSRPRSETEIRPDNIPDALQSRDQWLLWDSRADRPKRPHAAGDFAVSWSDPDAWQSFRGALGESNQQQSWGIGYVTAVNNDDHPTGVVSVIDIDGGRDPETGELADWVPDLDVFDGCYMELSPSQTGIHIPVVGTAPPEWWSDSQIGDHEGIDVLSNKFCTVTGWQLEQSGDGVARWSDDAVTDWLADAYEALTGGSPERADERQQSLSDTDARTRDYDDDWPDAETAEEMLDHISPNCEYGQWRNIGFALADHFSEHQAKRLYDRWSRGGSKYDDDAVELIDDITSRGSGGVGIGTLVHHAKQNGWEGENPDAGTPTPRELVARESDEYDSVADVPEDIFGDDETAADGGSEDTQTVSDGDESDPWQSIYQAYRAAEDADERLPARYEATEQLLSEGSWRGVIESDVLWRYDHETGIYRADGDSHARSRLAHELQEQFKAHEQREIVHQLKGRRSVNQEDMRGPDKMVCAQNCVLEVTRDEITPRDHSPEFNFVSRLETEYDPEADAPRWRAFIDESIESDEDAQKLQEFVGYTLWRWDIPFHKALFMVGPTASGKSTFLDTVRAMLGDDCTTSLTPQQMTTERFGGAELYQSWANIRNDIPSTLIENTGQFKEIVAGDPIKAERKFKDPFFFRPTTKHMFSANELPSTDTDDEAFFRRILLVAFPSTVPKGERDPRLTDKLETELPGILNWALDGLQRLMQQGRFTGDRLPGMTAETWQKWGSSVERFAKLAVEDGDEAIAKSELYQIYVRFCEDEAIPSETQHKFTRSLKTEGFEDQRTQIDGRRQRAFVGIELTGRGEELRDQDDDDGAANPGAGLDGY